MIPTSTAPTAIIDLNPAEVEAVSGGKVDVVKIIKSYTPKSTTPDKIDKILAEVGKAVNAFMIANPNASEDEIIDYLNEKF